MFVGADVIELGVYDAVAHFKLEHKLLSMYLENVELSLDSTVLKK